MVKKINDTQITDDIKLSDAIIGVGFIALVGGAIKIIFGPSIILGYIICIGIILLIIGVFIRKNRK